MHGVIDPNLASKRQQERFMWHEKVIADPKLSAGALRFAALVMHDRDAARKGYVTLSIQRAAKRLGLSKRATQRGRNQLLSRGWLYRLDGRARVTACYALSNGPTVVDDTPPAVVDDTTGPRAQQVLTSGSST
jgi:hypothetical protein